MACAAGEVKHWATDGQHPVCCGALEFALCGICEVSNVRGLSETKIWTFHNQRGGAKTHLPLAPLPPEGADDAGQPAEAQ